MSGAAQERRGGWLRSLHALALRNHVLRAFIIRPRLIVGVLAGLAAMIAAVPMLTDVMVDISATAVANAGALVLK